MIKASQSYAPRTQPLPHQVEAIRYLLQTPNAALFDEQGLGKSKIVVDALAIAMRDRQVDAVLVVAPLSLVYVWQGEVLKHSYLVPMVLRGSRAEKRYRFLTGANFYITNYQAVVAETERVQRFCRSRRLAVVLDEAAHIKNPATRTARALFSIAPLATRRVIVTGTPVANKPEDLWAQFYFLDGGQLLGSDYDGFRAYYDEKNPDYQERLAALAALVASNCIRRTKAETLELPGKVYRAVAVDLSGRQRELYDRLREELRLEVTRMDGAKVVDEADNILKRLLRLTQIASNPMLVDRSYDETPAKFPLVRELVDQVVLRGEKAVVWCTFVDNIAAMRSLLARYSPLVLHGEVPVTERMGVVTAFQEVPSRPVLIANPAAAREGLTLTRANNAIYVDRSFSLSDYLQSQDRIHRISQTRNCTIHKLIARHTVDEYIDSILDLKADVAAYVQGDVGELSPQSSETLLTRDELLEMLGG